MIERSSVPRFEEVKTQTDLLPCSKLQFCSERIEGYENLRNSRGLGSLIYNIAESDIIDNDSSAKTFKIFYGF